MAIKTRKGPLPDNHPLKGASIGFANSPFAAGLKRQHEQQKQTQSQGEVETESDWTGRLNGQRVARFKHQNQQLRSLARQKSQESTDPTPDSSE